MRPIFLLLAVTAFVATTATALDNSNITEYNDTNIPRKLIIKKENRKFNIMNIALESEIKDLENNIKTIVKNLLKDNTDKLNLSNLGIGDKEILSLLYSEDTVKLIGGVKELILSNNQISTDGLSSLFAWLKLGDTSIQRLDLSHNKIGEKPRYGLGTLPWNTSIKELNLSSNEFKDGFLEEFATTINGNKSITKLDLSNNKIIDGIKELFESLEKTSITDLILVNCKIDDSDLKTIGSSIKNFKQLKILDLSYNKITDSGLNNTEFTNSFYGTTFSKRSSGFSKELKGVWKLQKLFLNFNKITKDGWVTFTKNIKPWCTQAEFEVTFYLIDKHGNVMH